MPRRPRAVLRQLLRLLMFGALPALSAVSPLIVLPTLTATFGASGWSAIAVGQSIGTFGALILSFGWAIEGPSLAARTPPPQRAALYATSMESRALTGLVAVPLAAVAAFVVAPVDGAAAAGMAVATTLTGALPSWYMIGTQRPLLLACTDTVPRVAASIAAAIAVPVLRFPLLYPGLLLLATLVSVLLSAALISGRVVHVPRLAHLGLLRRQLFLVLSGVVSSGYTTLSVTLVAVAAPASVARFAATTRLLAFGTSTAGAFVNAGQGWVGAHDASDSVRTARQKTALALSTLLGLAGATILFAILPLGMEFLFSGTIEPTLPMRIAASLALLFITISMSTTFHVLVPRGRTRTVATSGLVTSVLGVPSLLVGARLGGAEGAIVGLMLAEIVSTSFQLVACAMAFRGARRKDVFTALQPATDS